MPENGEHQQAHADGPTEQAEHAKGNSQAFDAFVKEYKKSNEENATREQKRFFWEKFAGIGIAIYVIITLGILAAAIWQTVISQQSLTAVQRAFIAGDLRLTPFRDRDNKLQYWRVALLLENSGATPAKNMQWVVQPLYGPAIDPEVNEIEVSFTDASRAFLGPKARFGFWDALISRTAEERIIKGERFFVLGRVNYLDTLHSSPHTTKFCFQVYGPPWRADMPANTIDPLIDGFDLGFNMCRRNNCADTECK